MPGAKPGERRGGRKKGTPNKATAEHQLNVASTAHDQGLAVAQHAHDRTMDVAQHSLAERQAEDAARQAAQQASQRPKT